MFAYIRFEYKIIILVCRAGDDEIISGSPFFVCKSTPNSFICYNDSFTFYYYLTNLSYF